mgnify:CR=1 FL=1
MALSKSEIHDSAREMHTDYVRSHRADGRKPHKASHDAHLAANLAQADARDAQNDNHPDKAKISRKANALSKKAIKISNSINEETGTSVLTGFNPFAIAKNQVSEGIEEDFDCGCEYCSYVTEEILQEKGEDKKGHYRSTESGAGMTAKGAKAAGIKTAVTTPPSKLDPDSKPAKRRKSFCARSRSWNGERGKAARARWNC